MKKIIFTILTILSCGGAYALPVGNPSDASLLYDGLIWEGHCADMCDPCVTWCDAFSVRIGFYGDYVFNRHMQVDTIEDQSDIETRLGTLVVGQTLIVMPRVFDSATGLISGPTRAEVVITTS